MAVARRYRERSRVLLGIPRRRPAGRGPGCRRRRPQGAAIAPAGHRLRPPRAAQRSCCRAERRRAGARRLPPHRCARGHRAARLRRRPIAGSGPPHPHDAIGPCAAARAPQGQGRPGRDPGGGPALHQRGSGGLPERHDGPRADGGRRGSARGAHRGLDRGPPARRALAPRTRRRRVVHRLVRRRRPLRRGLPGRRGACAPARGRPRIPAPDVDTRADDRAAVRCGHRPQR